ncbi:hypothetical protein [Proteus hauseri]|uniref:hypothetical protein n=1 Tax=Proteus hauseri TaxID=183417 RepID=UPI0032DBA25D
MHQQQEFISDIKRNISLNKSLLELREILITYKETGLSQVSMRDCLNQLRILENEELVLELLDFVEGFCRADWVVFN